MSRLRSSAIWKQSFNVTGRLVAALARGAESPAAATRKPRRVSDNRIARRECFIRGSNVKQTCRDRGWFAISRTLTTLRPPNFIPRTPYTDLSHDPAGVEFGNNLT